MIKSKVSIIIPFFNRINYVLRAIDSVIKQTYDNWELILVNDHGNVDDLPHFNDSRIHLINNTINIGPGGSRQIGLGLTKGDFVCFLDSDDFYHPLFLEKMLQRHIESNNELSFVYCTSKWIDKKGNVINIYKNSNLSFYNIMPVLLFQNRPWNTSSIMWKKKLIPKWNQKFSTWEDYLFEFEASMINNNIAHLIDILCFIYKDVEEGLSNRGEKPVGIAHRSHILQIMLKKTADTNLEVRFEILKRLKKEAIKISRSGNYMITLCRIFLALRHYSLLQSYFSKKDHWFLFKNILKTEWGRKVYIKVNLI